MTGEEICSIINKHIDECGQPPQFDFDEYEYVSYFENSHGDQSLFLYDSTNNDVIIYLADAGWENPQKLPGHSLLENTISANDIDIGILPDDSEKMWLKACKSAVQFRIDQKTHQDSCERTD